MRCPIELTQEKAIVTETARNAGAPWSAADLAQLDLMMSEGIDRSKIAAQFGRTEAAIQTKFAALQRLKNPSRRNGRLQRRHNGASFFLS
jgi:hypothetical protein